MDIAQFTNENHRCNETLKLEKQDIEAVKEIVSNLRGWTGKYQLRLDTNDFNIRVESMSLMDLANQSIEKMNDDASIGYHWKITRFPIEDEVTEFQFRLTVKSKVSRDVKNQVKAMLKYEVPQNGVPESEFEEQVGNAIESMGYHIDYQIQAGKYRLDICVRDPNNPKKHILTVECDGPQYHGSLEQRDNDRIRQGELEDLGWTFHRIWGTDWADLREQELRKLKKAIKDAISDHEIKCNNVARKSAFVG